MTAVANPRHMTESVEHYTPSKVVEAARATLGSIDLDPASCEEANETIRAKVWLGPTSMPSSFPRNWWGRVFLNPPGGRSDKLERRVIAKCRETGACGLPIGHTHDGVESSQKKWWFKLAREWASGRVSAAIFVCFSLELFQTTQVDTPDGALLPLDFPICFPSTRVAYRKPGGKIGTAPPHASAMIFLPPNNFQFSRFRLNFGPLGRVVIPHDLARREAEYDESGVIIDRSPDEGCGREPLLVEVPGVLQHVHRQMKPTEVT